MQLVVAESFDRGQSASIAAGFRQRLGSAVDVTVEFVPQIAPEKSGKFRYVVSHALEAA